MANDLPMTRTELTDAIDTLPGEQGWSDPTSKRLAQSLALDTVLGGLSPQRTYDILARMYRLAADETMAQEGH